MVPLPLRDENPTLRPPVVTISLIVINCICWFYQLSLGLERSVLLYGAIPDWVLSGINHGIVELPGRYGVERVRVHQAVSQPLTVLTSMFMHGSWMHIIGNMWFLWIFGDNVEDAMGRARFVIFYLICGAAAAMAQILAMPHSAVPMVGASGAIAGVLGAYILLYPHARVRCLWILIIFITTVEVPAWLILGLWFVSQFFVPRGSGIAWMAHVGGFVAGFLLIKAFIRRSGAPGGGSRWHPRPAVHQPGWRWQAWPGDRR